MPPPPDRHYEHRFHAGNVGDVWKHAALVALFDHLGPGPHLAIDTHAGAGWYALGPTGEWTEGFGQLRGDLGPNVPPAIQRYLELAARHPPSKSEAGYPGASGARSVAERHGVGSAGFTPAGYPGASGARSVAERHGVGSAGFTPAGYPGASGARSVAERHGVGSAGFTPAGYPGASGARSVAERHGVGSAGFTPAGYPGSPMFLASLVGPAGRVLAYEISEPVARALASVAAWEPRIEARTGDGLADLTRTLGDSTPEETKRVLFVDPPFADRKEWETAPDALVAAFRAHPNTATMLWYPVKSLARPNAMLARLERTGVPGVALELITSPLTSKKNRLNGSGLVLLDPSPELVGALAALASWLGPRLAVHEGYFQVRINGFGRPGRRPSPA